MLKYSIKGITVTLIRDIRKKDKKENCPIRIRVTFQRHSSFYSTGYQLCEAEWEILFESKSRKLIEIRESLERVFDITKRHVKELGETDTFSFINLNKRLTKATGDTINTAFNARVQRLSKEGKISTSDWYKNTLNNLIKFAGENIRYSSITTDWLKKFERHLLEDGKTYTTVSMLMRALRAVINEAKEAGIIKESDYPFGVNKYQIPEPSGRAMALTIKQVGAIVNFKCKNETMMRCRDLWFFSYLCNGINITDLCKLKYSNIENGEIYFYRQKTFGKGRMSEIRAVITPEIKTIIERWGNKNVSPNTFIFNILTGRETPLNERRKIKNFTRHINEYMVSIGKSLEIGKITTYHARHSYATVLKRSGANISYISESLGHSNLKTTENYLAKFESEERARNAKSLTNF
ncbi:tyrosine-type recombinase/integrase [Rubrolithibacter danxiaensis]|uniref:tyrosine-type recombinase/integrase n=1 Tax=Rubrolithibacter danxiaensis TaxID=3390805 RepID=UPI003BF7C868